MTLHEARERRARATRQVTAAAFVLVFVALAGPILFGLETFGLDATRYDVPLSCAMRSALASDGSLWVSRLFGGGAALGAEPGTTPFYPPHVVMWLLEPGVGRTLEVALHLAFAAAGVAFLARTFRVRAGLALAAGVGWVCLGPSIDLLLHSAIYATGAAWGAWIWALARAARHPSGGRRRGRAYAAALSAAVGLGLLAGDAQGIAVACIVVGLESAARLGRRRTKEELRVFARVASAGVAGALAGFVQVALVVGELPLSRRAGGFPVKEALAGELALGDWPGLVLFGMERLVVDGVGWMERAPPGRWLGPTYVSAAFVALALAGALFARRARVAALVAGVLVLLALGTATPLAPLVVELVPGGTSLRYPAKLLPLALVAASVCAAVALDRSRGGAGRRQALAALGAGVVAIAAAVALVVVGSGAPSAWAAALAPAVGRATFVLVAVALLLARARRQGRSALVAGAPLLVDVMLAAAQLAHYGPPVLSLPSLVADLAKPEISLCVAPSVGELVLPTGRDDERFANVAALRAWGLPGLSACDGVVGAPAYGTLQSAMAIELELAFDDVSAAPVALGCTHVVSRVERPWLQRVAHADIDAVAAVAPSWRPRLYAVRAALPRAFALPHEPAPVLCPDEGCTLRAVFERGAGAPLVLDDPIHRRPLAPLLATALSAAAAAPAARPAHVELVEDREDRITMRTDGPALVVLRRPLLVGWQAVGPRGELPVLRAAGHLLALAVDGAGEVRLRYEPPGLAQGAVASVAGWLGVLLLGALAVIAQIRTPRDGTANGDGDGDGDGGRFDSTG